MMTTFSAVAHQLKWLEMEAPRYTSYPSALYFKPKAPETHRKELAAFNLDQSVALYIHIPFCKQLCWFCGCHTKIANQYSPIASYVQSLMKEIDLIGQSVAGKIILHSIHFGGGSPGMLSAEDLDAIFQRIHATFIVEKNAEIAIELDPRQLTKDKIHVYKHHGFNRVSLGVQDTNKTVQDNIHRTQPLEQVRQCIELLRTEGIHAINMDLIYGLPFQTIQSIEQTINEVCSMAPSRVAFYSFAHVPWMKKHQRMIQKHDLPTITDKGHMYLHALKIFQEHGYQPLGIDHFAKERDDCYAGLSERTLRRNFMGYTTQPNDYVLGIGASAISHLGEGISQNSVNEMDYKQHIEQGVFSTARGCLFTAEDLLRKAIINELMCYFSVDVAKHLTQHQYPIHYFDEQLALLNPYSEEGVISLSNRRIQFNSPLRMIVRSICSVFDQYHLTLDQGRYLKIS